MDSNPKIVTPVSTSHQVFDWLRTRILRGDLVPGAQISEAEIAKQIGVSRQPVREAFIRLATHSLAEVRPQRGTYISAISKSAVLSARLIRESVEVELIRMLAPTVSDDDLAELDALVEQQQQAAEANDGVQFVSVDDQFHRYLVAAAKHAEIWDVLEGLKSDMNRVRYLSAQNLAQQVVVHQHRVIVDSLRERDASRAEQAMRQHLQELLNDLPEIMRAYPDYFRA